MSRMLSKMNLISVVQQLPKEDVEIIQSYVEMFEKENQELNEQLKQRDEVIDEAIKLINQYKDFCKRNIEDEPYDNISKQNNLYWKYCISKLDYLLEILQKHKGDNNE